MLATLHECAHWLAARAVGVPARIRISRRLFFLAFETDLTGLWSVPRRRRFGAILAGMALDAAILAVVLGVRLAGAGHEGGGPPRSAGAWTFLQITAIATQFFVFLADRCLRAARHRHRHGEPLSHDPAVAVDRDRAGPSLATGRNWPALPSRDRSVARWYRWVWLVGMALARSGSSLVYFVPTTVRTVTWVRHDGAGRRPGPGRVLAGARSGRDRALAPDPDRAGGRAET